MCVDIVFVRTLVRMRDRLRRPGARPCAQRGACVHGDVCIYIYIYMEREREREYIYIYIYGLDIRIVHINISLSLSIYIYIYIDILALWHTILHASGLDNTKQTRARDA